MEDLNDTVATLAGYYTLIQGIISILLKLLPKPEKQKSFKKKRKHKRKK